MALHITVGYKGGAVKVLYAGNSAHDGVLAYQADTECDSYELIRQCRGIRKGANPKTVATVPAVTAPAPEPDSPEPPRRGRPPKSE